MLSFDQTELKGIFTLPTVRSTRKKTTVMKKIKINKYPERIISLLLYTCQYK